MSAPRPLPKKKGDLEDAYCPVCKSKVTRPFGTASVCGPHGHPVPATVFQTGGVIRYDPSKPIIIEDSSWCFIPEMPKDAQ